MHGRHPSIVQSWSAPLLGRHTKHSTPLLTTHNECSTPEGLFSTAGIGQPHNLTLKQTIPVLCSQNPPLAQQQGCVHGHASTECFPQQGSPPQSCVRHSTKTAGFQKTSQRDRIPQQLKCPGGHTRTGAPHQQQSTWIQLLPQAGSLLQADTPHSEPSHNGRPVQGASKIQPWEAHPVFLMVTHRAVALQETQPPEWWVRSMGCSPSMAHWCRLAPRTADPAGFRRLAGPDVRLTAHLSS